MLQLYAVLKWRYQVIAPHGREAGSYVSLNADFRTDFSNYI